MESSWKIKNNDTFVERYQKLLTKYSLAEITRRTGISKKTLIRWEKTKGEIKATSKTLEKLLKGFPEIKKEEFGIREIKEEQPIYAVRIKELRNEKKLTQKELTDKLDIINVSTLSNWEGGREEPSPANYKNLSEIFAVSVSYIKGDTNVRNADNELISLRLAIEENAIKGLENIRIMCEKPYDDFGEMYIDPAYADLISELIGNINFWETLMFEASRLIALYTNETSQTEFEANINDLGCRETPLRLEYEELTDIIISKALKIVFHNYIDKKLKELNLQKRNFTDEFLENHLHKEQKTKNTETENK